MGRTSPAGLSSIVPHDAHGGGGDRGRSIRRSISANSARGTATSASWKTAYRPWRRIRAPTVADAEELGAWLRDHAVALTRDHGRLAARLEERCRARRIEPPSVKLARVRPAGRMLWRRSLRQVVLGCLASARGLQKPLNTSYEQTHQLLHLTHVVAPGPFGIATMRSTRHLTTSPPSRPFGSMSDGEPVNPKWPNSS